MGWKGKKEQKVGWGKKSKEKQEKQTKEERKKRKDIP
jgi:hypothetical protein